MSQRAEPWPRHGTLAVEVPTFRKKLPTSSLSSVGNGPFPTRVVYALTTPIVQSTVRGATPKPVQTPPTVVDEDVTLGWQHA